MKGVFKQGPTSEEGAFRTPWINPRFMHSSQIIKEKELLKQIWPIALDWLRPATLARKAVAILDWGGIS